LAHLQWVLTSKCERSFGLNFDQESTYVGKRWSCAELLRQFVPSISWARPGLKRSVAQWEASFWSTSASHGVLGGENSRLITDHTLAQIGAAHGCSAATVALAWAVRSGNVIALAASRKCLR
jgi:aryl-alcohol dehydrogenase-like predicted oxidoreductase